MIGNALNESSRCAESRSAQRHAMNGRECRLRRHRDDGCGDEGLGRRNRPEVVGREDVERQEHERDRVGADDPRRGRWARAALHGVEHRAADPREEAEGEDDVPRKRVQIMV